MEAIGTDPGRRRCWNENHSHPWGGRYVLQSVPMPIDGDIDRPWKVTEGVHDAVVVCSGFIRERGKQHRIAAPGRGVMQTPAPAVEICGRR